MPLAVSSLFFPPIKPFFTPKFKPHTPTLVFSAASLEACWCCSQLAEFCCYCWKAIFRHGAQNRHERSEQKNKHDTVSFQTNRHLVFCASFLFTARKGRFFLSDVRLLAQGMRGTIPPKFEYEWIVWLNRILGRIFCRYLSTFLKKEIEGKRLDYGFECTTIAL